MSFVYGTNAELLFSMPAAGATITGTSRQVATGTTPTNPAFLMPAFGSIWSPSQMVGKVIRFVLRGGYGAGTAQTNTMLLSLDTTIATPGITVAATGAISWGINTNGAWEIETDMSCVSCGATTSTWYSGGLISIASGSAPTTWASSVTTFGNAINAGVPQQVTAATNVSYFPELYTTWTTTPTTFVCTQFQVWALN